MLREDSSCASVNDIGGQSKERKKSDTGVYAGRPVKAVIGANFLSCSDGALFRVD